MSGGVGVRHVQSPSPPLEPTLICVMRPAIFTPHLLVGNSSTVEGGGRDRNAWGRRRNGTQMLSRGHYGAAVTLGEKPRKKSRDHSRTFESVSTGQALPSLQRIRSGICFEIRRERNAKGPP